MIPIRSRTDFADVLLQPRAFLFFRVFWSGPALSSEKVAEKVVTKWQATQPDLPAPCYVADLSEQCGEMWDAIGAWLVSENRPAGLMWSGAGPLLWLRSGHVVAHVVNSNYFGVAKLTAASRSIFAPDS